MTTLHITRGAPASGKSTFARAWVAEQPERRIRVNRDDLRKLMFNKDGGQTTGQEEALVTVQQQALIRGGLDAGLDVISDDTNLTARFVKDLLRIADKAGAQVEFHDEFLNVDLLTLLARDRARVASVGEQVVRRFHQRAAEARRNPVPALDNARPVWEHVEHVEGLPTVVLVDIDGTLAHMDGKRGPFEEDKVGLDTPDPVIVRLVQSLLADDTHKVIFMSGRSEKCRFETLEWLNQHVTDGSRSQAPRLHMRAAGDMRGDDIVKNELFNKHILGKFNVEFILDDRNRVVNMWRARGLKVLQVADGDF